MFARTVQCEDCGQISAVRGYGRIEYDWPEIATGGQEAATPTINYVRLMIDCPLCGVKPQDYFPNGVARSHHRSAAAGRELLRRRREMRSQWIGPMSRQPG